MHLSMSFQQAMVQSLQLVGGATASIFPQVEALLLGNGDYQKALRFVATRKNMERYRSIMDFLFCELHPAYRRACFRFYEDKGPQLRDQINAEELVTFNNRLLKALEIAQQLLEQERCQSWGWYCEQVEDAIRAAA